MFRYNYHPLKNKESSTLIFLILFSALIRVPVILTLGDAGLEHEWKAIMESLTKHGVFSSKNFDGFLIPNLFMPPLYAFYLYFFFHIITILFNNIIFLFLFSIYKKRKFFINFLLFINRRSTYTFKRRVYCDFYFESFLSIIFFKNRNKKNFFSWFNNIYYNFALCNQKHLDI